jgi:hypothetical protein
MTRDRVSGRHSLLTNFDAFAVLTLAGCPSHLATSGRGAGAANDSATDAQSVRLDALAATPNKQTQCRRKTQSQLLPA